jgi:hypothetical protein
MEKVDGLTLCEVLRRSGPLDQAEATKVRLSPSPPFSLYLSLSHTHMLSYSQALSLCPSSLISLSATLMGTLKAWKGACCKC